MKSVHRSIAGLILLGMMGGACMTAPPERNAHRPDPPVSNRAAPLGACPAATPTALPERFAEFDLPETWQAVVPSGRSRRFDRIDLVAPASGKTAQRFFLRTLPRTGNHIIATDYEGFEAEVYFAPAGKSHIAGIVRIVISCDETSRVAIELFKGKK